MNQSIHATGCSRQSDRYLHIVHPIVGFTLHAGGDLKKGLDGLQSIAGMLAGYAGVTVPGMAAVHLVGTSPQAFHIYIQMGMFSTTESSPYTYAAWISKDWRPVDIRYH